MTPIENHELQVCHPQFSASTSNVTERASSRPPAEYCPKDSQVAAEEKSVDQQQAPDMNVEIVYPGKPLLVILTVALMIAIFMIGLDTNVIGESKPFWLA